MTHSRCPERKRRSLSTWTLSSLCYRTFDASLQGVPLSPFAHHGPPQSSLDFATQRSLTWIVSKAGLCTALQTPRAHFGLCSCSFAPPLPQSHLSPHRSLFQTLSESHCSPDTAPSNLRRLLTVRRPASGCPQWSSVQVLTPYAVSSRPVSGWSV